MIAGKAYRTSQTTAGTDERHPRPKAVAEVTVVKKMLIPISSMVSRTRSSGDCLGSVRMYAPDTMKASSRPIPGSKSDEEQTEHEKSIIHIEIHTRTRERPGTLTKDEKGQ